MKSLGKYLFPTEFSCNNFFPSKNAVVSGIAIRGVVRSVTWMNASCVDHVSNKYSDYNLTFHNSMKKIKLHEIKAIIINSRKNSLVLSMKN